MSLFSRIADIFVGALDGKPSTSPIVDTPTTTMENVLNAAGPAVITAAAAVIPAPVAEGVEAVAAAAPVVKAAVTASGSPSATAIQGVADTLGSLAGTTAKNFISQHVSTTNQPLADTGAVALAAAAIGEISTVTKPPAEIQTALAAFLAALEN